MILNASQIFETQRHKTEAVQLGEGQELLVRALPAHVIEQSTKTKSPEAFVFVNAVVDAAGKRLFTDEQADEVADQVASSTLQLIWSKAYALSVVPQERQAEIKKNLQALAISTSGE